MQIQVKYVFQDGNRRVERKTLQEAKNVRRVLFASDARKVPIYRVVLIKERRA